MCSFSFRLEVLLVTLLESENIKILLIGFSEAILNAIKIAIASQEKIEALFVVRY